MQAIQPASSHGSGRAVQARHAWDRHGQVEHVAEFRQPAFDNLCHKHRHEHGPTSRNGPDRLDVITCAAVNEAGTPQMFHIGSYKFVFRPRQPPWEPSRRDTWSRCTADVQSAPLGPDGVSRESRRGRSAISVSRRYLRNVARCTVKRPSKRPSSYMPKLSTGRFAMRLVSVPRPDSKREKKQ